MSGWTTTTTVLVYLVAGFALGAVAILLGTLGVRRKQAAAELWRLYWTEFLIVGTILIPAALGGVVFTLALLLFAWRGQWELLALYDQRPSHLTLAALCLAAALIVPFAYFGTYIPFALACLAVLVFVILVERLRLGDGRRELPVVIAAFLFPAVLVGAIVALRSGAQGFAWIVFVFAVVEANDSFALLGGKLFGRHRILPRLSPRKTAEGLIVGIVFGAAAGVLLGQHLLGLSLPHSLFLTAGALAAGLAGDLITSALKRSRGKKDFPPVLSAHGGMLDICDSLLFAAPVVALLRPLLT